MLFTTHPAYGHLHPLLPLAGALRDGGHEVRFAAGARFGQTIRAAGFDNVPAGVDWLEADKSGMPAELRPSPESTIEEYFTQQFVTATAGALARDVVHLAASWRPDIVVRERTEFGGALAADLLSIPIVAVQVGSPSLFTTAQMSSIDPAYNAARAGLSLLPDIALRSLESQPVLWAGAPELFDPGTPKPSRLLTLRPAGADHHDAFALPERLAQLGQLRPLVYATLGTVFNNPAFELPFFPSVLEGLRDEDLDVIATVGPNGDPEAFGSGSPNVYVERYIPQSMLFPLCSAVICHAGYGTMLAAVQHAVPIIAVPFGADQHLNARTIERLGIGAVIDEDDVTPSSVRAAVRAVLHEPTVGQNIRRLRDSCRELPTFQDAVQTIEALVRVHGA